MSVLAGLFLKFNLNGVPVTVVVTLISMIGWVISFYASFLLVMPIDWLWLRLLVGLPVLLGSLYLAVLVTAQIIKPIRKFMGAALADHHTKIIGQTLTVRTSRVDEKFGEAVLDDGGAGLILKIRAMDGQVYQFGESVVAIEYDPEQNHYRVISEVEFLGQSPISD